MVQRVKKSFVSFLFIFALAVLVLGGVFHASARILMHGDSYKTVNKSITISKGKEVNNITSVNGSVNLKSNIQADKVSSVNGSIKIANKVSLRELSSVNGSIRADEELIVKQNVSSVNGSIDLNRDSIIEGKISTVNGRIELSNVLVKQNIETVNGSIELTNESVVEGDIVYKWNNKKKNYKGRPPELFIDTNSEVKGEIILERPVTLKIKNKALLDKVKERF